MVWWIVEGYPEGIQFSNFPSTNWIPWSPRLTFRSACPLRAKDLVPEVKLEMTKGKNAGLRAIHKEQTASRRSQPSSRIASKGELSFPWNLLRKWFTLDSFGS